MKINWLGLWFAFWRVLAVLHTLIACAFLVQGDGWSALGAWAEACVAGMLGWPSLQPQAWKRDA